MKCYHHTSRDAVAQCQGPLCKGKGKAICKDCFDDWKLEAGPWAGDPLCYDCSTGLVEYNATELEKLKSKAMTSWIIIAVLSIIGAVMLSGTFLGFWGGLGIGGNIWIALKSTFTSRDSENSFGLVKAIFWYMVGAVTGPIVPGIRILLKRRQIKKLEQLVADERESLRLMQDYFAYTLQMENAGDSQSFENLTAEGGVLFNNSYAQAVATNGEVAAQQQLRNSVVQIATNGEIIRRAG